MLEDFGESGQQRLRDSTVLIAGLGGLGSPAALYLAAAGVGRLLLADHDIVDSSNLQRQILYASGDVGADKCERARARLQELNPHLSLVPVLDRLNADTLDELAPGCDLILDCSDNLPTRQAINRASVRHRKPLISAAALRWEGSLSLFDPRQEASPCLACMVPPDSAEPAANCANSGVLGPVLGVMGSMQALVAVRALAENCLAEQGTTRHFDGKRLQWLTTRIAKKPACPVCGPGNNPA